MKQIHHWLLFHKKLFFRCESSKQITIPSSIAEIGEETSAVTIKKAAFQNCISLKEVLLPSTIKLIENETFKNCESLKEIIILSSTKEIGFSVFESCKSLTKVTFPSHITMIKKKLSHVTNRFKK